MIEVTSFRGRSVGVFGLARSGLSTIESLIAGGARVFAWDDREASREAATEKGARLENWPSWPWSEIGALVLSPGVPLTHPEPHPVVLRAMDAGAEVIGDVELFARTIRPVAAAKGLAPIIAITGTNGKSTTTTLVGDSAGKLLRIVAQEGNSQTAVARRIFSVGLRHEPEPEGHDG